MLKFLQKNNKYPAIFLLTTVILIIVILIPASVFAEESINTETVFFTDTLTHGDYQYTVSENNTITITGYNGNAENLTIPSLIEEKKVTSIASNAFHSDSVKTVIIPDSIQTIESYAFYNCYHITGITINGSDTLLGYHAFFINAATVFTCSSESKAYLYAKENQAKIALTNGISISGATVTLGASSLTQYESDDMRVSVTVTLNGKTLQEDTDYICTWAPYSERNNIGTKTLTITAKDFNKNHYTGSCSVFYDVIPPAPEVLCTSKKITASSIPLTWIPVSGVSGYYLYRLDPSANDYKLIKTITNSKTTSFKDTNLKRNTSYKYRIVSYFETEGRIYCSNGRDMTCSTTPKKTTVNSSKKAKVKTKKISLKTKIFTESYYSYHAQVSSISDFFDSEGRYTIAYGDKKYLYISILNNTNLSISKTIKIKKPYPLIGSVTGGPDGNYYVVWAQKDWKSGNVVVEISKYNKKGAFIKSCKRYNTGDIGDTSNPFFGGNCTVAFQGNTLICSYARQMNNVHQSSDVFSVNIDDMTENTDFYNYVSHSFDQRVIALSNGDALFADLGDAFPRGFSLTESGNVHKWNAVPFHFYGSSGDNFTNAQLGGIGEVSTGIVLVGTSAPSMTKKSKSEDHQLFIQIVNPITQTSILNNSKRKGTSCGKSCTDTGIRWLTNRNEPAVIASHVAIMENDRILVLWENKKNESFYTVISASGKTLQKTTKIGSIKLNTCEELKYRNGCVYWTTANGKKRAEVHKLYIGKFK